MSLFWKWLICKKSLQKTTLKPNSYKISICIPSYKRLAYLTRLIESIKIQTFKDFEVIITDDSGEDSAVQDYVQSLGKNMVIRYYKNAVPLGSPVNFNAAIEKASGSWVKLMHDDDYFSTATALEIFAEATENNVDCIFCGYHVVTTKGERKNMTISESMFNKFLRNPFILFADNYIGPPSLMMFRNSIVEKFDKRFKWIVDWEYYIRLAFRYKIKYIRQSIVDISYNETQITNICKNNPAVEIPEIMQFYAMYGNRLFKRIKLFDAWWRLVRNLQIRDLNTFQSYTTVPLPKTLEVILGFQSVVPNALLRMGLISKLYMSVCYVYSRILLFD